MLKALKIIGSHTKTARACNVSRQVVWNWANYSKRLPAEHVINLEKATGGQVSRHDLRPDIYPREG